MSTLAAASTSTRERALLFLLIGFIAFNIFLAIYCIRIDNIYAIKGQIGFVAVAVVLYLLRKKLQLTTPTFVFLLAGIGLHVASVLGRFYYISPVPIPWDYLTHIISFIGLSCLFFNFYKRLLDDKKIMTFQNISLFVMLFLAVGGVGVLIELSEYSGYIIFGAQNGALLFGGGDFAGININSDVVSEMEMHGGGWLDAMDDLLINSYATIASLVILSMNHFYRRRNN